MDKLIFLASIAKTEQNRIWRIVYIDEGETEGRGWVVGREALQASLPIFEHAWVQSLKFDSHYDHLHGDARAMFPEGVISGNIIGLASNPRLEQIDGRWAIVGEMRTASDKADKLLAMAAQVGRLSDFGLSINAESDPVHVRQRQDGLREVLQFDRLFSVDMVTHPARGGGVRELLASAGYTTKNPPQAKARGGAPTMIFTKRLQQALDAHKAQYDAGAASPLELLASVDLPTASEGSGLQEMLDAIIEALKGGLDDLAVKILEGLEKGVVPKEDPSKTDPPEDEEEKKAALQASLPQGASEGVKRTLKAVLDRVEKIEAHQNSVIVGAKSADLPQEVQSLLASKKASPRDVDLAASVINSLNLDDSGHVALPGGSNVNMGLNSQDKFKIAAYKMMGGIPTDKEKSVWQDIPEIHSIQELYIRGTGDTFLEAYKPRSPGTSFLASSGLFQPTDFPYLLGDSLYRAVVDIYREEKKDYQQYVTYRQGVSDFRNVKINRIKGMGLLPRFEDDPAGTGLVKRAVPGEEQGTYQVEIFSDKVVFSFKFIKDDDMDAFNVFKRDYTYSCIDTVNFHCGAALVGATIAYDGDGNASISSINTRAIYDTKVLYHADHNNLLTAAISYQQIQNAMQKIRLQNRAGSNGRNLRQQPWGLWYPIELGQTVDTIVDANGEPYDSNNNPNNVASLTRIMLPKEDVGDSAVNWGVITDPKRLAVVQLAFLDGQESPWITTTTPNQTAGAPWDFLRTEFRGVMMFGVGIQAHEAGVMSIPS